MEPPRLTPPRGPQGGRGGSGEARVRCVVYVSSSSSSAARSWRRLRIVVVGVGRSSVVGERRGARAPRMTWCGRRVLPSPRHREVPRPRRPRAVRRGTGERWRRGRRRRRGGLLRRGPRRGSRGWKTGGRMEEDRRRRSATKSIDAEERRRRSQTGRSGRGRRARFGGTAERGRDQQGGPRGGHRARTGECACLQAGTAVAAPGAAAHRAPRRHSFFLSLRLMTSSPPLFLHVTSPSSSSIIRRRKN